MFPVCQLHDSPAASKWQRCRVSGQVASSLTPIWSSDTFYSLKLPLGLSLHLSSLFLCRPACVEHLCPSLRESPAAVCSFTFDFHLVDFSHKHVDSVQIWTELLVSKRSPTLKRQNLAFIIWPEGGAAKKCLTVIRSLVAECSSLAHHQVAWCWCAQCASGPVIAHVAFDFRT